MKPASLRALDLVERGLGLGLYAWLTARIVAGYWAHGGGASLFILPSEGLVVLCVRATGLWPWPRRPLRCWWYQGSTRLVPPTVAAAVMLTGTIVQLHAKLTLGRSFGCVAAHRGLQLDGPYRFVRHPMYAGYLVGRLGFLLVNPTRWNVLVCAACYALQVPPLLAEERLLGHDERYRAYRARVRWHLLPGIY